MDKVVIEITRKDVESCLSYSHLKIKEELVTEILDEMQRAYKAGEFPLGIEDFLWEAPIFSMLEDE